MNSNFSIFSFFRFLVFFLLPLSSQEILYENNFEELPSLKTGHTPYDHGRIVPSDARLLNSSYVNGKSYTQEFTVEFGKVSPYPHVIIGLYKGLKIYIGSTEVEQGESYRQKYRIGIMHFEQGNFIAETNNIRFTLGNRFKISISYDYDKGVAQSIIKDLDKQEAVLWDSGEIECLPSAPEEIQFFIAADESSVEPAGIFWEKNEKGRIRMISQLNRYMLEVYVDDMKLLKK